MWERCGQVYFLTRPLGAVRKTKQSLPYRDGILPPRANRACRPGESMTISGFKQPQISEYEEIDVFRLLDQVIGQCRSQTGSRIGLRATAEAIWRLSNRSYISMVVRHLWNRAPIAMLRSLCSSR